MTQLIEEELLVMPVVVEEEAFVKKNNNRLQRRARKAKLKKLMSRVTKKTKPRRSQTKHKALVKDEGSIRTYYERVFESYLKVLGMPYVIDTVFCFACSNYYIYGNHQSPPRRCQVCMKDFYSPYSRKGDKGHLCRPDFVLDYNNTLMRAQYRQDTQHHRLDNIRQYQSEYLKRVAIVRIDGSIHDKKRIKMRDYHQVVGLNEAGVKVFIITNDDIDRLLDTKDNGKSMLKMCLDVGDCVLDELKYRVYTQDPDFVERTKRP